MIKSLQKQLPYIIFSELLNYDIFSAGPNGGGGGTEGHVPPQEAVSALNFFFHVLLKEKRGHR